MKFVLGILVGLGFAFSVLAIIEKEEQKKLKALEKIREWERKLP